MQPPRGSWLVLLSALSRLLESLVSSFCFRYCVLKNDVDTNSHGGPMAIHRVLVSLEKWVVLMGSAINNSLVSAHFSISAYLLTPQTSKRMHLTTRLYGMCHPALLIIFMSALIRNGYGIKSGKSSLMTRSDVHSKSTVIAST